MQILTFGIARDLCTTGNLLDWPCELPLTVGELKAQLMVRHPSIAALRSFRIAVNEAYANDDVLIQPGDEVAIIPPVSGG
jgi:molybdopterin converting factor subunit 1